MGAAVGKRLSDLPAPDVRYSVEVVAFKSLDGLSGRKETGSEKERGGGMSTQVFLP